MRSGHDEESRNGRDVKIYIWEVVIRTPEKFGGIPVLYRGHQKGSKGPPGGPTSPGGPHGPWREGNQPLEGWVHPPPWEHAPRVWGGTLEGAPPLLGGQAPSLGRPPLDLI